MKNTIKLLSLFFVLILSFSCKKEHNHKDEEILKQEVLNIKVNAGATFQLDLHKYTSNGKIASIKAQAMNYAISQINYSNGLYNYAFKKDGYPKAGGNGKEQVILKFQHRNIIGIAPGGCYFDDKDSVDELVINLEIL